MACRLEFYDRESEIMHQSTHSNVLGVYVRHNVFLLGPRFSRVPTLSENRRLLRTSRTQPD